MKIELIEDWRKAWRFATVQWSTFVLFIPDIYNGIAAMGWLDELPGSVKWLVRGIGAVGIIARVTRKANVAP